MGLLEPKGTSAEELERADFQRMLGDTAQRVTSRWFAAQEELIRRAVADGAHEKELLLVTRELSVDGLEVTRHSVAWLERYARDGVHEISEVRYPHVALVARGMTITIGIVEAPTPRAEAPAEPTDR